MNGYLLKMIYQTQIKYKNHNSGWFYSGSKVQFGAGFMGRRQLSDSICARTVVEVKPAT